MESSVKRKAKSEKKKKKERNYKQITDLRNQASKAFFLNKEYYVKHKDYEYEYQKHTVTFFLHPSAEALLKSARWTATSIVSIHCTVVISTASVWCTVSDSALEKTFTTFACADSIMFPGRLVSTNSAVQFICFCFYFWKFCYGVGVSTCGHFVMNFGFKWLAVFSSNKHALRFGWKPSRFSSSHSCIQFVLIINSTMARSSHKLDSCQIFIVKRSFRLCNERKTFFTTCYSTCNPF